MRILSVDPGIVNLAVCRLVDGHITHWEVINLMDDSRCARCSAAVCAEWRGQGLCAGCLKAVGGTLCPFKKIGGMSKAGLVGVCGKLGISAAGTKPVLLARVSDCVRERYAVPAKRGNANLEVMERVAERLVEAVSDRGWMQEVDCVCVERQIKARMKCVEMGVYTWAALCGLRTRGILASCKLSLAEIPAEKRGYKGRKKAGVAWARALIPEEKWREYLDRHGKKDDLADCFLMAVYVSRSPDS